MAHDPRTKRPGERLRVRVADIRDEAVGIKSFELRDPDGSDLPPFEAGSHLLVDTAGGFTRQYSLCNDPVETGRYVITVQREEAGRGGSREMCDLVRVGDVLSVSPPRNNFSLFGGAATSLLIAGGIGITPILAMCRRLQRANRRYTLHYCSRSAERTAFRDVLAAVPFADNVRFHHDGGDPQKGLDVASLLAAPEPSMHLYCCGPAPLMRAVEQASAGWPRGTVHFEHFSVDADAARARDPSADADRGFDVEIASTGQVMYVAPDRTILSVLREHGVEVESLCQGGICGTCVTGVLAGIPDHRDQVLDDTEKSSNKAITVCCSRAISDRLVLDL